MYTDSKYLERISFSSYKYTKKRKLSEVPKLRTQGP